MLTQRTTHDDGQSGRKPIAKGHLSDSGDLKVHIFYTTTMKRKQHDSKRYFTKNHNQIHKRTKYLHHNQKKNENIEQENNTITKKNIRSTTS